MSLLPPSTNHLYRGSLASVWFLGLYGLLEFGTGCVHYCLPDGGAGMIVGLDLTANKHTIIGVFAWMGALQIAYGLGIIVVACWYRLLVPLFLGLGLLERRPEISSSTPSTWPRSPAESLAKNARRTFTASLSSDSRVSEPPKDTASGSAGSHVLLYI